jgi:hypothetical protein
MNTDQLQTKIILQEENKKYFIPAIEDIHHGYECEMLLPAHDEQGEVTDYDILEWRPIRYISGICVQDNDMLMDDLEGSIKTKEIRTPYLTREQIELEGWEPFLNGYKKDRWTLLHGTIKYTERTQKYLCIATTTGERIFFRGDCPSINELRQICKLLNIK